nr:GNAT family N-acetyltransferase [uncultured Butyrivibrio sp.]
MKLRDLELKDLPLMKEWMQDKSITSAYRRNFEELTDNDITNFILNSKNDHSTCHCAIVSDIDEYMGTVSLKHIENGTAELAIIVRKGAMRRGYAWFGMEEILDKAFQEYNLDSVYWCVNRANERALRFYDKHSFHEVIDVPNNVLKRYEDMESLKWYSVLKGDEINIRDYVAGCKVIHIKTIPTVDSGELSFFEGTHEVPFEIKRIYYISKVPEGTRRGFHAHKELKQVLFCPYGRIQIILENKNGREEIELSDPSIGIVIEECTWREMLWLQKDSVLCVAASDFYKVEDYIRDYDEFRCFISSEGKGDEK